MFGRTRVGMLPNTRATYHDVYYVAYTIKLSTMPIYIPVPITLTFAIAIGMTTKSDSWLCCFKTYLRLLP